MALFSQAGVGKRKRRVDVDMLGRSVEAQRILGGVRVCTMGLCARNGAEFGELQRVGCHAALPISSGVAGDAALSPRLGCAMGKLGVSGLEF